MKRTTFLAFAVCLLLFSCYKVKKKNLYGSWTPSFATVDPYGSATLDTLDSIPILEINSGGSFTWTGFLSPGDWYVNGNNSKINMESASSVDLWDILACDEQTLELETSHAGATDIYHILFTK